MRYTSDLLISTLDITFDHHTFYQCFDVWIQVAAVKHFVHDTNLFCILFVGVGVVCIHNNSRVFEISLFIETVYQVQVFIVVVRDAVAVFVYSTT